MAEGYHDFVAAEVLTAANIEDYCELQTIMRFASEAARDSALSGVLTEGLVTYQKDTNQFTVYTGSAWTDYGRLSSVDTWTPDLFQPDMASTVTKSVTRADYIQVGNLCFAWFALAVTGGSGTAGQAVKVSVPLTAVAAIGDIGGGWIGDASTPNYAGRWHMVSSTQIQFVPDGLTNYWGVTPSVALANGDSVHGQLVYRTA